MVSKGVRSHPILLAAVLVVGCKGPPEPSSSPAAASSPGEPESDPYAAYVFPPVSDGWGVAEYTQVRDVLVAIEQQEPELLVTLAGPHGGLFAHLASLDTVAKVIADTPDLDAMFELTEAFAQICKLYTSRVVQGQQYGSEYLLLSAATLRAMTLQFARLAQMIDEATLRAEPVRRDGLLEMRHGLVVVYFGVLQSPQQQPGVVDAAATVAQLVAVASDMGPFLLSSERQELDQLLDQLLANGAQAAQVAETRSSIAASPLHPLVAAFRSESRAYSESKREIMAAALEQQLVAVELGPEQGGIRYAFPGAGFSAVFHQRPNAMAMNSSASDGATVTTRVLGIRDATGYSTTIVCMSRPPPPPSEDERSFARQAIENIDATGIRESMVGGRPGFEGALSSSVSRALMQTVDVGHAGCTIIVEYPPRLEASSEERGRAFLRSIDLAKFEG